MQSVGPRVGIGIGRSQGARRYIIPKTYYTICFYSASPPHFYVSSEQGLSYVSLINEDGSDVRQFTGTKYKPKSVTV